ncbi:hypothetical protein [uncultured Aquimarina sp.]|uniref:hypothetical protein n=1 Tax=uncultured Aquimarina sp. TaxID=575652 RepID=UPI002622AC78|nr:hypothetical protein [uncultured Aquimarina sp.]
MKKSFYVLPIIGLLFFASCDKDESNEIAEEAVVESIDLEKDLYDFHKDVMITSDGGSQAIMRVYSNSETAVNSYTSEHFKLVETLKNESLSEGLIRQNIKDGNDVSLEEEKEMTDFDTKENAGTGIAFKMVSVTNTDPNVNYSVSFYHPENIAKSWSFWTHYSGIGQTIATIDRHSALRRVYFGLKRKAYSTSGWSIHVSEWRFLGNGNSYSLTANTNYQFRFRVKSKRSSAYTVNFSN